MSLSTLTVSKIFQYVDQKRIYTPQDGSTGLEKKYRALSMALWDLKSRFILPWDEITVTGDYLDSNVKYPAPADLDHLIAVSPDDFSIKIDPKTPEEFKRMYERGQSNILSEELADGVKTLYLKFNGKHKAITVNSASSKDGNGDWTADSDALNVTTDNKIYKEFSGSVNFDIDVSQSANNYAGVYVANMSAVDLEDEADKAHFLVDFYIPDKTYITSFDLFWGSSDAAYWTKNVTTQINGGAFKNGWNVLDFDWSLATKVGSPDSAAIDYIQIRINYSASQGDDTDFRVNYIRAVLPESVDYRYSTAYIAKNTGGSYIDEIGATNDVMLFSGTDTKFMKAVISGCLYQLFGDDNQKEGAKQNEWERKFEEDIFRLEGEYPPRRLKAEKRVKISR